jgi:hypothetical protein
MGAAHGGAPHRGLLQIAELIGTDHWKAELFDPERELSAMREDLARNKPESLAAEAVAEALEASAEWPEWEDFADAWFEDDEQVDRVMLNVMKGKGRNKERRAVEDIAAEVMEPRRSVWLERLALMALWLKAQKSPPVPWQRMFHVAAGVAVGRPLKDIPLMLSIAKITYEVAMERNKH